MHVCALTERLADQEQLLVFSAILAIGRGNVFHIAAKVADGDARLRPARPLMIHLAFFNHHLYLLPLHLLEQLLHD